jgi:putative folate metabolism gamma-glutamate ligase
MIVTPIKTEPIVAGANLTAILDTALPTISDKTIIVITSKIVSIAEGRLLSHNQVPDKHALIRQESEQYVDDDPERNYGITLTLTQGMLIASAGIDESNGNDFYILWPKDPFESAKKIWEHLKKKHNLQTLGVIIADSRVTPLRWGTTGIGMSWCGFMPLKNYIGTPDIFGHDMRITKQSILDGLTSAANVTMGEGNEQTPIVTITDVPFVTFVDKPPTAEERTQMNIALDKDIFAPLLGTAKWKKGGK